MTLLNMLNFLPYDVDELHELLALFRVFPGDARAGAAAHLGRAGKNRQQAAAGGLGTWQPVPGRADETSPAYDRSANLKLIKDRSENIKLIKERAEMLADAERFGESGRNGPGAGGFDAQNALARLQERGGIGESGPQRVGRCQCRDQHIHLPRTSDIRCFPKMRDHVRNLLAASAYSDTLTVMRQLAYHALNLGVGGWSTKRILVVDDSRVVRKYVARLLEREGYTIDFAANGHEALAQMKKRFYDCVFMDLEMPGEGIMPRKNRAAVSFRDRFRVRATFPRLLVTTATQNRACAPPVMNGQDCTKALRNWEAAIDRSRRQMICAVR